MNDSIERNETEEEESLFKNCQVEHEREEHGRDSDCGRVDEKSEASPVHVQCSVLGARCSLSNVQSILESKEEQDILLQVVSCHIMPSDIE